MAGTLCLYNVMRYIIIASIFHCIACSNGLILYC